jgi:hypothetical protein
LLQLQQTMQPGLSTDAAVNGAAQLAAGYRHTERP